MNKSLIALLSFILGVILTTFVCTYYFLYVRVNVNINEVKYDETQIIKNMINEFENLKNKSFTCFSLSYFPSYGKHKPSFYVNVDYGTVSHKESFFTYEEFIDYISNPEKYHTKVINVSK